ncbi:hypothetical protein B0T26DRAFT_686072 [Lasiosphaeria miniovina]|uniref:Vacuolar protein sorting/targeting protein 10 n=1 Tax=Lasiosphaeria miniovina TaxID=1954250 RepID=A0AA40BGL1_9PEZI|nr:uncharacterized protein B0T26DRAFT_686072 [Lasiosphaeria miniovina]KAK0733858.1 hypothetical protein B0T26DRAFT_686072 [Lasiosphaeria miniovina]
MRLRGAIQAAALLAIALVATPLAAKKDRPTFEVRAFDSQPRNLNYLPGSNVVLFRDSRAKNIYISINAGGTWKRVDAVPDGEARKLYTHPYDPARAYIITDGNVHWRTHDRGKTWTKFNSLAYFPLWPSADLLQFHASDPDRIIFNGEICNGFDCFDASSYTTDDFKTTAKPLRPDTSGCWWAKSSDLFSTGDADLDRDRILCIARDPFAHYTDQRLVVSDDFFKSDSRTKETQEFEPNLDMDKAVRGIVNVAAIKKYLLVATASKNTDEMALFVSDDTKKWHRAMFPAPYDSHDHRLLQEAYTVLESTNYSLQIDVMTTPPPNSMGVIFTSNSNGTFFTENVEHTNRNHMGNVDFEKIADIQGIFMVNKVDNWKNVEKQASLGKKVISEITFDDGRTFESVKDDKGKRIHLHSYTELENVGRVFSSPAPGLVMGVGNTGEYLKDYWKDGRLYVSDDAGKTWIEARDKPHKYEFGDQGSILVAVQDSEETATVGEISYSLDHGVIWEHEPLPNDMKILPYILTTTQDSSSLKFLLIGESPDSRWQVISIDFDGLHEATCKEDDLEEWHARVDDDGKPTCLMGHTQSFRRRKKKAECFLKQEFKHAFMEMKNCDCTELDYECDYNFVRDEDGKCTPRGPIVAPDGACPSDKPDATFKGTSGYRKIPGNTCNPTKDTDEKFKEVERKCSDAIGAPSTPPATDKVTQHEEKFEGWIFFEKHYIDQGETSQNKKETVIMRPRSETKPGPVYVSQDHGKSWEKPKSLDGENIWRIVPHPYYKDMVFFLTKTKKSLYTANGGATFHEFNVPVVPDDQSRQPQLSFHPDHKDWLIWMGKECDKDECYRAAYISDDRGHEWKLVAEYVRRCEFTGSSSYRYKGRDPKQIICQKLEKEVVKAKDNPWILVTSTWREEEETVATNIKDFATTAEFIVVAREEPGKGTMQALASLNGKDFAEARFPLGFDVPHQHAYTVLDSSTHAVNLFVATETAEGRRLGTILKSNSNGTSYVLSIKNVNCNDYYYVDFEKMQGLEGVSVVNVVVNPDEKSASKKLQTKITHNDGSQWSFLPPPKDDEFGSFSCESNEGDEKCALHLHGYSDRTSRSQAFSSEGAVGIMFAWGTVGDFLGSSKDMDTFLTVDAGISWKRVKKGRWLWALGDHGSVIVLAAANKPIDTVYFSLDQGATWQPHKFTDKKIATHDVTTLRTGNSRNFLLWGSEGDKLVALNLNFEGFTDRVCKHDQDDDGKSDYNLWWPEHPNTKNGCLFGHKSIYLRKKPGRKCFNDFTLQQLYANETCKCVREDYECDYNYELHPSGQCKLVDGLTPQDPQIWCSEHPDEIEYHEPTGFRRIPLTTCTAGDKALDTWSPSHACKNHEDEFERKHATSGLVIFLAVIIPVGIAAAAGWYVWRNWSGNFGQIRLGEHGAAAFDSDKPWVRYPVIAISAVVAVIAALPIVAASVWRALHAGAEKAGLAKPGRGTWSRLGGGGGTRTFTTRDSFARGQGDYDIVDEDEGELLGEDSDEEV